MENDLQNCHHRKMQSISLQPKFARKKYYKNRVSPLMNTNIDLIPHFCDYLWSQSAFSKLYFILISSLISKNNHIAPKKKKKHINLKSKIIKVECSVYGNTTYEAQTEIIIELEDTYGQITQNLQWKETRSVRKCIKRQEDRMKMW